VCVCVCVCVCVVCVYGVDRAPSSQVAVPKYLKLELMAATSTTVPAGSKGQVTQLVKLTNSLQVCAQGGRLVMMV
jgi:hypothetical protein